MNTYYVARGKVVTGPFAEGQIIGMWKTGAITADAQVCLAGDDEWGSVTDLMEIIDEEERRYAPRERDVDPRVRAVESRKKEGCLGQMVKAAVICFVGLIIIIWSSRGDAGTGGSVSSGSGSDSRFRGGSSIKSWMKTNLADPEARLIADSEVKKVGSWELKKARIAARNRLGGPVIENWVFEINDHMVIDAMNLLQFGQWLEKEKGLRVGDELAQFQLEVDALVDAPLYAR